MNVRTLCLAVLQFGDATGYEIKKMVEDGMFNHFIEASYGSIYPALTRMSDDGLVTCRTEAQSGKPDKKIYSITDGRTRGVDPKRWEEHHARTSSSQNFCSSCCLRTSCPMGT